MTNEKSAYVDGSRALRRLEEAWTYLSEAVVEDDRSDPGRTDRLQHLSKAVWAMTMRVPRQVDDTNRTIDETNRMVDETNRMVDEIITEVNRHSSRH